MRASIAVLPGDGIGPEVMTQAERVLSAVADIFHHTFSCTWAPIGGAAYEETGMHFPPSTLTLCQQSDAVLFGSVGGPLHEQHLPTWKDAERNAILGVRKALGLGINLRPSIVDSTLQHLSPLKERIIGAGVDMLIVRELLGDVYFGEHVLESSRAHDIMEYTVEQIEPVIRFACEAARHRRKHVTVVDKANVLDTSRLWRRVTEGLRSWYQGITIDYLFIDNAVMQTVLKPSQFDVVATSNLFGDILSDAAAVLPGSLGLMPSASLGERIHLYEPIGGSAPDIAGKGIANPIAQILSVALMLRYSFHLENEARAIEVAIDEALADGIRTRDIAPTGDVVGTVEMTNAIVQRLHSPLHQ